MTDNDIIKALECCGAGWDGCEPCPLCNYDGDCLESIVGDILNLITRQKAEIERLKATVDSFTDIGKLYSEIKAEAIKEFAERLCEDRVSNDPVVIAVKCELKEMAGDV